MVIQHVAGARRTCCVSFGFLSHLSVRALHGAISCCVSFGWKVSYKTRNFAPPSPFER